MFGLGHWEMLAILGICVLLFGAKRIPELGQGLGKGIRGFKRALGGLEEPEPAEAQKELPMDQGTTAARELGTS